MKILHIAADYHKNGGIGSYLLNLCRAFQSAGHDVVVVHSDKEASRQEGIRDHYVPGFTQFDGKGRQENSDKVMQILERERPDIIHIQTNQNFAMEALIRKRFATVKSIHVYDFCPTGNKFHNLLKKECHHPTGLMCLPRMVYKRCTLSLRPSVLKMFYDRSLSVLKNDTHYPIILVASENVRKKALASGYREDQIQVLPYFADKISEVEIERSEDKIILFVGRVVPEKGLDLLIEAVSKLGKIKNWKLVVNGQGPTLKKNKERARHLGLEDRVKFVGWLKGSEHFDCYRRATLVAVPSIWPEPFGLVGIEAMSYGKPVVAFRSGGIPEWLEDGKTGYLAEPFDVDQLAEKIKLLLENDELAQQMGAAGKKRAEKDFSLEKHAARLTDVYRQVIAHASK